MASVSVEAVPGPQSLPKIGPAWNYVKFFHDPIRTLRGQYHAYGPVSGLGASVRPGHPGTLIAIGPEYNQQVLSNPRIFHSFEIDAPPGTAAERLGTGIVYLNGEHHKQQRRLIMPAFHKKELDGDTNDMIAMTHACSTVGSPDNRSTSSWRRPNSR